MAYTLASLGNESCHGANSLSPCPQRSEILSPEQSGHLQNRRPWKRNSGSRTFPCGRFRSETREPVLSGSFKLVHEGYSLDSTTPYLWWPRDAASIEKGMGSRATACSTRR